MASPPCSSNPYALQGSSSLVIEVVPSSAAERVKAETLGGLAATPSSTSDFTPPPPPPRNPDYHPNAAPLPPPQSMPYPVPQPQHPLELMVHPFSRPSFHPPTPEYTAVCGEPNGPADFVVCLVMGLLFGVLACLPALCSNYSPKAKRGAMMGCILSAAATAILFVVRSK